MLDGPRGQVEILKVGGLEVCGPTEEVGPRLDRGPESSRERRAITWDLRSELRNQLGMIEMEFLGRLQIVFARGDPQRIELNDDRSGRRRPPA